MKDLHKFNFFKSLKFLPGAYVRHAVHGVRWVDNLFANNRLVGFLRSANNDTNTITLKEIDLFNVVKSDLTYKEFSVDITVRKISKECI